MVQQQAFIPLFQLNDADNTFNKDRLLWSNTLDEICIAYGASVYYMPVDKLNPDTILGDYKTHIVKKGINIRLYLPNPEAAFNEKHMFFGKFGEEFGSTHDGEWFVSLRLMLDTYKINPNVGDLIYYPVTQDLFEIEDIQYIYQYMLKIVTKLHDFNHATMESEVLPEIKHLETINDLEIIKINNEIKKVDSNENITNRRPGTLDGLFGEL